MVSFAERWALTMEKLIINIILKIVNKYIENETISMEQCDEELALLGMDSINFIQIVTSLEEVFEIRIPDEKLLMSEMGTIHKMVDAVVAELGIQNISKWEVSFRI